MLNLGKDEELGDDNDKGQGEEEEDEDKKEDVNPSQTNAVSDSDSQRILLKAVEIVSAARYVSRLTEDAAARHRRLVELTRRADVEVKALREIASCLGQAASSVARAALEDCRHHPAGGQESTLCCRLLDLKNFLDAEIVASSEAASSNPNGGVEALPPAGVAATSDGAVVLPASPLEEERDGATPLCCPFAPRRRRRPLPESYDENADLSGASLLPQNRFLSSSTSPCRLPFQSSSLSCISVSSSSVDSGARSETRFSDKGSNELISPKQKSDQSNPSVFAFQQNESRLKTRCLPDCPSSDSEVEILLERKPAESPTIQKLRTIELRTSDAIDAEALLTNPKQRISQEKQSVKRPISPLLDNCEKDNYTVSKEEAGSNSPKHLFTPPASVISSLEHIDQTRSEVS